MDLKAHLLKYIFITVSSVSCLIFVDVCKTYYLLSMKHVVLSNKPSGQGRNAQKGWNIGMVHRFFVSGLTELYIFFTLKFKI